MIKNIIYIRPICLTFLCMTLCSQNNLSAQETVPFAAADTMISQQNGDSLNLIEAVNIGDSLNVLLLLENGANPDSVTLSGNSALFFAIENRNFGLVRLLVEYGANVNLSGFRKETPLFISVFNNDFLTSRYLLENGADPNVKDTAGVTPLMYAAATNQYQTADMLLFYGADAGITDGEGNDPLLTSVTFDQLETSDILLQNGLSPNVQDKLGNTPAIVATQHGNIDILLLLLDYNADINIPDKKNYSPLAYAINTSDFEIVKLLIQNGANVNHQVSAGRNIMDLARISGNDSIITILKEKNAKSLSKPEFSIFQFTYGNSFNSKDYLVQFRGSILDSKFGYFIETGIDYRPVVLKIQKSISDTLYQFRERRIGWSHGIGKYFELYESQGGINYSLYASVNGYLSFPRYLGSSQEPKLEYNVIPSAGLIISGRNFGVKVGTDWYKFGTDLEAGLKINLSVFFKFHSPGESYYPKEINWE